MKIAIDPNDRQFLERLHRLGSSTVQAICGEMDVTATAVRQRLSRLQVLGLIKREAVRTGRGRPHHAYQVTDAGMRELGDNYADLAIILWCELKNISDSVVREQVFQRVQDALAHRYGQTVQAESLPERMQQLNSALVDQGYDVEVDLSGSLPVLRGHSCPYLDLANTDSSICELEQKIYQKVLGVDVNMSRCIQDGHHCCEFEAVAQSA